MVMSLVINKKAGFNHEILEKYQAGIELLGNEVKSVKASHGSLDGAYVSIRGQEAFLVGAFIPPYQPGNTGSEYDPRQARRLLLTKAELTELIGKEKQKGLTLIPLALFLKGRRIKCEFAIVRPKKKFDKREDIKKRETKREIDREIRGK
jgi:SsrA-binding protein